MATIGNEAPGQEEMGGGMMAMGDMFKGAQKIIVRQEFAPIELCGIESKNRYHVSVPKADGAPGNTFLYAMESSQCLERICCAACRSMKMNIHSGVDKTGPVALSFDKNFSCPMIPCPFVICNPCVFAPISLLACVMEPKFRISEPNGAYQGEIHDKAMPLFCCKVDSTIKDRSGAEVMHTGPVSLCQCGTFCPCCADMTVPVTKQGKQVATITRNQLDICELLQKTNRFTIDFGSITDPSEKKRIFAAAFLLDLQYWEQK